MILSHKYKFIFLKTSKTAGTSIEIALSKFCGKEDIITPITKNDEKARRRAGYHGARNYLSPLSDYRSKDFVKLLIKGRRKARFYNHIPAKKAKDFIGESIWNSYYKFCFERNPWDRLISYYYWHYKESPRPTISEFLKTDSPLNLKRRGLNVYTINGKVAVDKVCLYENISEELEKVRIRLGIPEKLDLPRAKSGYRKDRRHYREVLDQGQKEIIEKIFSEEIALFGYQF